MGEDQKRILLAIVLSAGIMIGWQYFFNQKQPGKEKQFATNSQGVTQNNNQNYQAQDKTQVKQQNVAKASTVNKKQVSTIELKNNNAYYEIGSDLSFINSKSQDSKNKKTATVNDFFGKQNPFVVEFLVDNYYQRINFEIQKTSPVSFKAISKKYKINILGELKEDKLVSYKISSDHPILYRFVINTTKREITAGKAQDFIIYGKDVERISVGDAEGGREQVKWFALDYISNIFAVSFNDITNLEYQTVQEGSLIVTNKDAKTTSSFSYFYARKNYDDLLALGNNLHLSVNFGWFGIISVPILRSLQFFYKYVRNYGIAIIIITLLFRIITIPLQIKSFKSMKKMQMLQPELQKIKEKFKDDPQRMQAESMQLFKTKKANPVGGCFPILIQMPIFMAFYSVLSNAIELEGEPFMLWITDLSIKDPYYVLPILMTLSMVVSQKLTPMATVDKTQKIMMMAMPLVMGIIFKDMAAGLCLYIFVSTLFGILQQFIMYRTSKV